MKTTDRRRQRLDRIKLMSIDERRQRAAEILAVGVLRVLAKRCDVREVEPGTDEYERTASDQRSVPGADK